MLMSTIGSATAKKSMLEFQLLRVARELIFDAETDKLHDSYCCSQKRSAVPAPSLVDIFGVNNMTLISKEFYGSTLDSDEVLGFHALRPSYHGCCYLKLKNSCRRSFCSIVLKDFPHHNFIESDYKEVYNAMLSSKDNWTKFGQFCPCLAHRFGAALASYAIDTVPRRMMMTSGEAAKYKSSLDAFSQILKNEGAKSLFKVVEANILRAIADAGVLAGYDKLHLIVFGKKHRSGSVKLSL
ncbi:hypothetical protein GH714_016614 [Hevea brasiliensis]|uniref:ADP/ATP translocase n=1 Tax=Hevea brasiliensis TaxID=3981 RepID=A0A6A6N1D7_HEVBR|nr:hypothetical protein GH714_016614 [Hevea brasiliensis]